MARSDCSLLLDVTCRSRSVSSHRVSVSLPALRFDDYLCPIALCRSSSHIFPLQTRVLPCRINRQSIMRG